MTTPEVAEALGVSRRRALQIIHDQALPTIQVGTSLLTERAAVAAIVGQERKVGWPAGRPRKAAADA